MKVRVVFKNDVFVFICVYVPAVPVERLFFLDTLCSTLQNCCTEDFLILGGDFKCTELNLDRNHIEPHLSSRNRLIHIIKKYELCNIWRSLNGSESTIGFTHVIMLFLWPDWIDFIALIFILTFLVGVILHQ